MISLFNIKRPTVTIDKGEHVLNGRIVRLFEDRFTAHVGAPYGVSVSSCTKAIELVMRYLKANGCKNFCEIPSMIPPCVPMAVHHSGMDFEFVDNTDWVGRDYVLYKDNEWAVIDSAHEVAHKKPFSWSYKNVKNMVRLYSFYPTKPVSGIDGGMVCSNNLDLINWVRQVANLGQKPYGSSWDKTTRMIGWKSYMSTVQAKVALHSLDTLALKEERLDRVIDIYTKELGVHHPRSYHLFRVNCKNRKELIDNLRDNDISSGIHYHTQHDNDLWGEYQFPELRFKKSIDATKNTLSIPFHENLTKKEIEKVCKVLSGQIK